MTEAVIELRDVSLTLGEGVSEVQVLRGVSLDVREGETTAVVGPSGSGKSTLLMVVAGLERVDAGTVRVAGEPLTGSEDRIAAFRGRTIGIVFQSFHLIANMTALENVAVPLELAERGMTLLLVTHDAELARRCSRQVSMRSGRIEDAAPSPSSSRKQKAPGVGEGAR